MFVSIKLGFILDDNLVMFIHICCSRHSTHSMALHQAEVRCEALPYGPHPVSFLIRWPHFKPSHGDVSIACVLDLI